MARHREKLSEAGRATVIAKTVSELIRLRLEDQAYRILDELHHDNWEGCTVREAALAILDILDFINSVSTIPKQDVSGNEITGP